MHYTNRYKELNLLTYTFKEDFYFPPSFRVIGGVIVIVGIALIVEITIISAFLIVMGIIPFIALKGIDVNFKSKMYRNPFIFFGKHYGSWNLLPDVEYISMYTAKKGQSMIYGRMATGTRTKWKEIEVNLIYPRNRRLNVLMTDDKAKALKIARQFEKQLDVAIYDATGQDKVWVERE